MTRKHPRTISPRAAPMGWHRRHRVSHRGKDRGDSRCQPAPGRRQPAPLDDTLILWHILTHRVPLLWRVHILHHIDLDLTASTALRCDFAAMMLSVPRRAAQVALIGIRPQFLRFWQTATLVEIMFPHAIHRATVRKETPPPSWQPRIEDLSGGGR